MTMGYESMGTELATSLEPGHSVTIGRAWDGAFYVSHTYTTPGQWLGEVRRTIGYGPTLGHAWLAPQEVSR